MSLANNYRPLRFEEIVGQRDVVIRLSGLILDGRARRSLLLHGSFGSGKTTLVRIYAKALNCENVNQQGSPCNACASCIGADEYLHEYDVPGRGGEEKEIRAWVGEHHRSPPKSKTRVLFFDEAQALTFGAMDILLKNVEEPQPGVIFCCATTEPWKLKAAFKSRLMQLEVSPLSVPEAMSLLERVAAEEGFSCDREALALLAVVKRGHPRDLLTGLEQVVGFDKRVTVESIKVTFDLDPNAYLVEYFIALACGDRDQQNSVMRQWDADPAEKVTGVRSFLMSLYYRNILSQDVVIDAVTSSITQGRAEIISLFAKRLNADGPRGLETYWTAMMAFWSSFGPGRDRTIALLQLACFEDFVTRKLPDHNPAKIDRNTTLPAVQTSQSAGQLAVINRAPEMVGAPGSQQRFITETDVREIVNRASFFTQQHGQLMNAAFIVVPSPNSRYFEETAVATVRQFCDELSARYGQGDKPFAYVALLERDEGGVLGRVVAHIPRLVRSPESAEELQVWCRAIQARNERELLTVDCKVALNGVDRRFHWDRVLDLCAGLANDHVSDADALEPHPLLRFLKIPKQFWRSPGPLNQPLLAFSRLLSTQAIAEASDYRMAPLSAFDAKAWSWIRTNWELKEFKDRKAEILRRRDQIHNLQQTWSHDAERCEAEITKAIAEWRAPDDRPRSWQTWRLEDADDDF